jgi:ParB family chromosome partitioning protein
MTTNMTYEGRVAQSVGIERPSADAWVSSDNIHRNPDNPRLIFRQKELDQLKKSIYEVGILQPLIVYQDKAKPGEYILIDGERRCRCARELNLKQVPVFVHPEPTRVQNITTMFNIHKLRIDWEPMPTALKLGELMELTGEKRNDEIARMCGMTESQVQQSRKLLFFPYRHQQMVLRHEIKDNFLIEMYPFIIKLRGRFPNLFDEYGTEKIIDLLIEKNRMRHIKAVTEFRDLAKLVSAADRGAPKADVEQAIRRVLDDPTYEIETAFVSVRAFFDVEQLTKTCQRLAEDILKFSPAGVSARDLAPLLNALKTIAEASKKAQDGIKHAINRP